MKSIAIIASALLLGCAAKEPKPSKPMNLVEAIHAALDIKIDSKEKNPIFYELPGRWRSNGTEENCETLWTEVSISKSRKTMTLSLVEKIGEESPAIKESYAFTILQANRSSLQLQDHHSNDQQWKLSKPNLWTFILQAADDSTITSTVTRCPKAGATFNVGKPVHVEDVDLSEALKNVNKKK